MKMSENLEASMDTTIKDIKLFARNEFVLRNKIQILPYKVKCYKRQFHGSHNTIYRSCKILNYLLKRK